MTPTSNKYTTIQAIKIGWSMLLPNEKIEGSILAFGLFTASFIDMLAVTSILPLVALVVEPKRFMANENFIMLSKFIGSPNYESLLLILVSLAIVLLIIAAFLRLSVDYFIGRFSSNCRARLAETVLAMCIAVPYHWFLSQNSTILSRMLFSDIAMWSRSFVHALMMMIGSTITLAMGMVLILSLAPIAGMASLLFVGIISSLMLLATRSSLKAYSADQLKLSNSLIMIVQQVIIGIKDIRLSANSDHFLELYGNKYRKFSHIEKMMKIIASSPSVIVVLLGQIGILVVVIILWKLDIPVGEISAKVTLLLLVSSKLIPSINRLTSNITSIWRFFPFMEGIYNITTEMQDLITNAQIKDQKFSADQIIGTWSQIKFQDIQYQYSADTNNVINNIDIILEVNKSYAVIGMSGAGKTTLIDIILGFLTPTKGQVIIDDTPLSIHNVRSWQSQIGHVPQAPIIFDDTLSANIAFGIKEKDVDQQLILKCIEDANLTEFISSLNDGINTHVGERGIRLSGGQRQRIAIARALYTQPRILILDEATSALDSDNERKIQKAIDNLHGNLTTIIIAHRLETVKKCDKLFLLHEGELVDEGTWDHLSTNNPLFQKLAFASDFSNSHETPHLNPTNSL